MTHPPSRRPTDGPWRLAEVEARLPGPDEVDVWSVTDADLQSLDEPELVTTTGERRRASRLPVEEGAAWLRRRAWLRVVLGAYLEVDPAELEIGRLPGGKPIVRASEKALHFSLSHSGSVVVLALSGSRVGADVERPRARAFPAGLLRRIATPAEWEVFSTLPETVRDSWALRLWTLKEASLKLTGRGIVGALESLQHLPTGCRCALPGRGGGGGGGGDRVTLWACSPDGACVASVAVESVRPSFYARRWRAGAPTGPRPPDAAG